MSESADLDHRVSKPRFSREAPKLREALLDAQYDLVKDGGFAALLMIEDALGKALK